MTTPRARKRAAVLIRKLRKLRKERGLTQRALARKARVSIIYVQKLEAEERKAPSLMTFIELLHVLGTRLVIRPEKRKIAKREG